MTVIKNKGEWQFGYKDTYGLDSTLNPIIAAGVRKFKEVLVTRNKDGKCFGVPSSVCYSDNVTDTDIQNWFDILDKIIYTFEDKEPDISAYNYNIKMINGDVDPVTGNTQVFFECDNDQEYNRYTNDLEIHVKKVQDGLNLFAKHYKDLWW